MTLNGQNALWCSLVQKKMRLLEPTARAGGRTPRTPRWGGLTHAQGPHVAYEKKIFSF